MWWGLARTGSPLCFLVVRNGGKIVTTAHPDGLRSRGMVGRWFSGGLLGQGNTPATVWEPGPAVINLTRGAITCSPLTIQQAPIFRKDRRISRAYQEVSDSP